MLAELTLIKRPEVTGDAGPAVLISVVRNEADILPAFFDHYRGLGIRSFVLIDNNSTDGTREVLLEQPDVILYAAAGSYREAFDGVS